MEVKGKRILLRLCLLVMCTSYLSASERTDQPSCPRGNYTLKATNITCKNDNWYPYCTWLLGIQHCNNSAIDTSCNFISHYESVEMFFALHDPLRQNGYQSWEPCPFQDQTLCFFFPTRVTDSLYVMVTINNNRLKSCTGITIEQVQVMNLATYTADELQEIEHFTARYKRMFSTLDALKITACIAYITSLCGLIALGIAMKINMRSRKLKNKKQIHSYSSKHLEETNIFQGRNLNVEATWANCIKLQCEKTASELLRDNILPTSAELQSICDHFGKRSKIKEKVCAKLCKKIVTVLKLKQSTNVWPAYSLSNNKIVFVVESEIKWLDARVSDFEIHVVNSDNILEKESQIVMLREKEILALCHDKFGHETFKKLQQVISENAKRLMDKHRSINVISPGVAKSIGYLTSGQHKLIESPCISIYVNRKVRNSIPLGEEPIPSKINGFPTDVLEGKFDFFSNGPNDYQQSLKIGCGIHAGLRNVDGFILGGTLGAFVKHKTFDLCCITSAHVVLSREELQLSKKYSYEELANGKERKVSQPFSELSQEFGKLVDVSCREGCFGSPSVEVALIQVQRRKPISGAFPHVSSGSDKVEQFAYNSGNVIDASLIRPLAEVYKFGMTTKSTTGYLGLHGVAINDRSYGVRLYNQLSILPKYSSFAENGDSGALVFTGQPRSTAAIGILEGGLPNGSILVSPIIDVLEALECPLYLYRFGQDSDAGINVDFPMRAEEGNIEKDMDERF